MAYLQWQLAGMWEPEVKGRVAFPVTPLLLLLLTLTATLFVTFPEAAHRVYVTLVLVVCLALLGASHALAVFRWNAYCLKELYRRYDLSPLGFLPSAPILRLSGYPAFLAFEDISAQLPHLIRKPTVFRDEVSVLPCPTMEDLLQLSDDAAAVRRLYVLFGQLVHSWVYGHLPDWGDEDQPQTPPPPPPPLEGGLAVVPSQLAVPFHFACENLGVPPVLTAAGTDLYNWSLQSSRKKPTVVTPEHMVVTDLNCVSSITGSDAERFFHMIPCAMQAVAGGLLPELLRIPEYLHHSSPKNDAKLTWCLDAMGAVLSEWRLLFQRIPHLVDRRTFFEVYRHLLNGFSSNGIVLRLDTRNRPGVRDVICDAKGPSAGQSTIVMIFDIILGVSHAHSASSPDQNEGTMRHFQLEMRDYMPAKHRLLLEHFEVAMRASGHGSVRSYVTSKHCKEELRAAFDRAVEALGNLRRAHLGVVTGYLSRTTTGTGASSFRTMLKEALDNTTTSVIGRENDGSDR